MPIVIRPFRLGRIAFGLLCCQSLGWSMLGQVHAQAPSLSTPALPRETKPALPRRVTVGFNGEETMQLAEFPLSASQQAIMVPVTFKGRTYTFMLDSGATHTVVDERLRSLLGERIKQVQAEASVGGTAPTDLYPPMDGATVGPLSLKDCGPVMVSDFQPVREQLNVACDGALGMSFIGKYLWAMDWDFQQLGVCESLVPPEKRRTNPRTGLPSVVKFSILLPDGKVNAVLDTGYTSVLGLEEARFDALERSGAISNIHKLEMATAVGMREVKLGFLSEFKLPRQEALDVFRKVIVTRSNQARLGLSFLKAYLVVWDAQGGTATLMPRSWIRELRKKNGLPNLPPSPEVPEPQTVPLPQKADEGR